MFVLTMFAVAIGSLSQAQAALASPRLPTRVASAAHAWTTASIATHSATGAVRAAAATRPMAHSARLRTEERQGSLPLGGGRRATETASAPTITAPKITSAGQVPNQACPFTSLALTTFTVGQPGTFTVTSTGVPNCTFSETGALPSGVTFADDGTLSGTPAAGTGGTYPFTITATNVDGYDTQSFTLTVNQPCQITSSATATFNTGLAGTFTVTSTGLPTCTLSETAHLPRGSSRAPTTGTAPRQSREHRLRAPAACTCSGSPPRTSPVLYGQIFTLIVFQRPQITSADRHHVYCRRGLGLYRQVDRGAHRATLLEKGALPSGVTFTDNGDGTATLSGTPAAGTAGTYTLTIGAINIASPYATHVIPDTNLLSLGAVQTFTLTVVGPPAAPSGLKATGKGRTVTLTWENQAKPPSAATEIEIQRSTNAKFTTAVTNTTVGPTVTSHKNTVVAGKKYYYRVRAYNAAGYSLWSNTASG